MTNLTNWFNFDRDQGFFIIIISIHNPCYYLYLANVFFMFFS